MLAQLNLLKYYEKFVEAEATDIETLKQLTEDHLKEMAIPIGARIKVTQYLKS